MAWGKNDIFFAPQGALAFQKDPKDVEVHLLNTGHFPLEEDLDVSASLHCLNVMLNKSVTNSRFSKITCQGSTPPNFRIIIYASF